MSEPANIQEFNRVTLHLFMKLYEAFPVPVELDARALVTELFDLPWEEPDDRDGPDKAFDAKFTMAGSTIQWLRTEGFIRSCGPDIHWHRFQEAQLSIRGLAIMGMPTELENPSKSETVSDKIKKALAKGTADALSDGMKNLLGAAARLGVNYVLGPGVAGPGGMTV